MLFPNKLINYNKATISKLSLVLEVLEEENELSVILRMVDDIIVDINEFIEILELLYLLDRITIDYANGRVKYAKRNILW